MIIPPLGRELAAFIAVYVQDGMFSASFSHGDEPHTLAQPFATLDALLAHVAAELAARRKAEPRIRLSDGMVP